MALSRGPRDADSRGAEQQDAHRWSESELAQAWAAGDPQAGAHVYRRYAGSLFETAFGLLDHHAATADAVQQTLSVAAMRISTLSRPERLRAWLFAVLRAETRARGELVPAQARVGHASGDESVTVWQAANALDIDEREIFELTVRGRLQIDEIADILGVARWAASRRLARVQARLEGGLDALTVLQEGRPSCPDLQNQVPAWEGPLTGTVREVIVSHALHCARCRRLTGAVVRIDELDLAAATPVPPLPLDLGSRVAAGVLETPSAWDWREDGFPIVRDPVLGTNWRAASGKSLRRGWLLARRHSVGLSAVVIGVLVCGAFLATVIGRGGGDSAGAALGDRPSSQPSVTAPAVQPAGPLPSQAATPAGSGAAVPLSSGSPLATRTPTVSPTPTSPRVSAPALAPGSAPPKPPAPAVKPTPSSKSSRPSVRVEPPSVQVCAAQNQTCTPPTLEAVYWYGSPDRFVPVTIRDLTPFTCGAGVAQDPAPGAEKNCYYSRYTPCGTEEQLCLVGPGVKYTVRYVSAAGTGYRRNRSGPIVCHGENFALASSSGGTCSVVAPNPS